MERKLQLSRAFTLESVRWVCAGLPGQGERMPVKVEYCDSCRLAAAAAAAIPQDGETVVVPAHHAVWAAARRLSPEHDLRWRSSSLSVVRTITGSVRAVCAAIVGRLATERLLRDSDRTEVRMTMHRECRPV